MSRSHLRLAILVAGMLFGLACVRHVHTAPPPHLPPPPPPPAPVVVAPTPSVAVVTYYDTLSPWGEWIVLPHFGTVWRPWIHVVGASFVPYSTGGRWEYSEYGWVFVSDYAFGPVVYHYGRWLYVEQEGWVWVPDRIWGPAWVEWRYGGGYVCWAPLPPPGVTVVFVHYSPTWVVVDPYWFPHGRHHHHRKHVRGHEASAFIANTAPVTVRKSPQGDDWHVGPPPGEVSRQARVELKPRTVAAPRNLPPEVMRVPENAKLVQRPLPRTARPADVATSRPGAIEQPTVRPPPEKMEPRREEPGTPQWVEPQRPPRVEPSKPVRVEPARPAPQPAPKATPKAKPQKPKPEEKKAPAPAHVPKRPSPPSDTPTPAPAGSK